MDHNRVDGTKHQVKGAVKQTVGKVTGDKLKEAAGAVEKLDGKFQKEVGKATDNAEREADRRH